MAALTAECFAADYGVLMKTAELMHKHVPSVESIGGYARIDNFYDKTEEQLRNLASAGYSNPYIGVESGYPCISLMFFVDLYPRFKI